jgi:RNA polymerase sigma factor (sigma-70 family)
VDGEVGAVEPLIDLVVRARKGDLSAYGEVVRATQSMAYAVARGVLRERAAAEDAVQDAYLKAFRQLETLQDPEAFPAWLRRIVITVALNQRRRNRPTLLQLERVPEIPVLDESEEGWTEGQRQKLAAALLALTGDERRICDRRYHGGWTTSRLAADAGIDEPAMRKRLQRIRDKLRKEIEVSEQRAIRSEDVGPDLPAKVIELLARPRLTDLPESPVGSVLETLRECYSAFDEQILPEVIDFAAAQASIGDHALYLDPAELHRADERRILRYDLTLPMLLKMRAHGPALRAFAAGKTYRACQTDATHLEAFHQAEVLWMDETSTVDRWIITTRVLQSADRLFPGREVKIVPTHFPMCTQAWELEVEQDGRFVEAIAWGVFTDRVVVHLGGDPERHTAVGVGHGLERLAMLRYGIDDMRKMEGARVA